MVARRNSENRIRFIVMMLYAFIVNI